MSGVVINRAVADQIDTITLHHGGHTSWEDGHCALEVCSQAAYKVPPEYGPCSRCSQTGEVVTADVGDTVSCPDCDGDGKVETRPGVPWPFTERPDFVSPILRAYVVRLNDRWDDDRRQALRPYLVPMVGTAYDGLDPERERVLWEALPGLVGPWLRLAGLNTEADALAAVEVGDVTAMLTACRAARYASRRVRDEARARLRRKLEKRIRRELEKRGVAWAAVDWAAGAAEAAWAAEVAGAAGAAEAWGRAYQAVRKHFREHPLELPPAVTELAEQQQGAALELLARLIDPTQDGAS